MYGGESVWTVYGNDRYLELSFHYSSNMVRPVITISESAVN